MPDDLSDKTIWWPVLIEALLAFFLLIPLSRVLAVAYFLELVQLNSAVASLRTNVINNSNYLSNKQQQRKQIMELIFQRCRFADSNECEDH